METIVLLVVADPVMREFYQASLSRVFTVMVAPDASAARTMAVDFRPHVIVIDTRELRLSPFCRDLREDPRTRDIAVIGLGKPRHAMRPSSDDPYECATGIVVPVLPDRLVDEIDRQVARAARRQHVPRPRRTP